MRRLVLAILSVALAAWVVSGQGAPQSKGMLIRSGDSFVEQIQERDSILIADQLRYGFHLKKVAEGTYFALPDFRNGFMDSVEIVSPWLVDTVKVYGGKNETKSYDIDVSIIITSFEEGRHRLVPLSVVRSVTGSDRIDTLLFDTREIDVRTMPVDTTTYQIHDIKGQVKYPLTLAELLPYVAIAWGLAIIGVLIWVLLSRKKKESEGPSVAEPAHVVALRKLDHYRGDHYWSPDKQKIFYSGITDALREYIESRYGVDAMEMTTAEIFGDLGGKDIPADLLGEARELFTRADYVKFAKALATEEENASALPLAVRFVTSTYEAGLLEEQGGTVSGDAKEKGGGR